MLNRGSGMGRPDGAGSGGISLLCRARLLTDLMCHHTHVYHLIGVGCIPAPMQRASWCMRGPRPRCCPTLRSWATSAQSTSTPRVRAVLLGCVGTGIDAAL